MAETRRFPIAQIGRTVGLNGDLKLHLLTDFPEQFRPGATFHSDRGELTIAAYNPRRGLVRFEGYDTPESARKLTNAKLWSDEEATRRECPLGEGEYYWFDIIGCTVLEGKTRLGRVAEIQRLQGVDYLRIDTDAALTEAGLPESFLIPYIPRYIVSVDTDAKTIATRDAREILEAS